MSIRVILAVIALLIHMGNAPAQHPTHPTTPHIHIETVVTVEQHRVWPPHFVRVTLPTPKPVIVPVTQYRAVKSTHTLPQTHSVPRVQPVAQQVQYTPPAAGEFCHSATMWVAHISSWAIPPSCYAGIYYPNPRNYVARPSFGWCNWWPEVLHPNVSAYALLSGARHSTPRVGALVIFAPGTQGAGPAGHYGEVVGINGPWILISEMNNTWRGAGFARVNYRYVYLSPGITFVYA